MQQLEKSPVGSAANSKQTATKEPLRRIERQSWQQHVKMLLSFEKHDAFEASELVKELETTFGVSAAAAAVAAPAAGGGGGEAAERSKRRPNLT